MKRKSEFAKILEEKFRESMERNGVKPPPDVHRNAGPRLLIESYSPSKAMSRYRAELVNFGAMNRNRRIYSAPRPIPYNVLRTKHVGSEDCFELR